VGDNVGPLEGATDGVNVGPFEGISVLTRGNNGSEGATDGDNVGPFEGDTVGPFEGETVGAFEGSAVGGSVGVVEGLTVGDSVLKGPVFSRTGGSVMTGALVGMGIAANTGPHTFASIVSVHPPSPFLPQEPFLPGNPTVTVSVHPTSPFLPQAPELPLLDFRILLFLALR